MWLAPIPAGSSLLTRGALAGKCPFNRCRGLIPAHAGSTTEFATSSLHGAAHPRSRGEHTVSLMTLLVRAGSSPLTRGARHALLHCAPRAGLIPAHAGSTSHGQQSGRQHWAHPRSRGEHFLVHPNSIFGLGSSPLTRGAPVPYDAPPEALRLIPAHAGSTSLSHQST